MRDAFNQTKPVQSIAAASYDADVVGAAVDQRGFQSCVYAIAIGAGGITFTTNNKIECKLEHSDDGIAYSAVTADDVQLPAGASLGSGGIVKALVAAHATADVTKVGYIGNRNFHRMTGDFSGTHGAPTPIAVTAILSNPLVAPVA